MLGEVVRRATTLAERLAAPAADIDLGGGDLVDEDLADDRMARWVDAAALGQPAAFARRLAWSGLDPAHARRIVGTARPPTVPPPWAAVLRYILSGSRPPLPASSRPANATRVLGAGSDYAVPLDPADPQPFEDVWRPVVFAARRLLAARFAGRPDLLSWLSEPAASTLERALLVRLAHLAAPALYEEFDGHRPVGPVLLARMIGDRPGGDGDARYRAFVARLGREEGLGALAVRWPSLARLVSLAVSDWVDAAAELLVRYAADRRALAPFITGGDGAPGVIAGIAPYLSDPHRGGRTVAILEFESGARIVYKPRPLAMESALQQLLAWCNRSGALPCDLRTVPVLDRGDYGWMAHVAARPCESRDAAERYYTRAGMLLALLHLLRGTDCHWENLVAAGEHPVLVDAEALFHHDLAPAVFGEDVVPPGTSLDHAFEQSVLRTGLLPRWAPGQDGGIGLDISGLGGVGHLPSVRQRQWVAVNTDTMRQDVVEAPLAPRANTPSLGEQQADPDDYVDWIVTGFEAFCGLVQSRRGLLLSSSSPLKEFADLPVRFVYRPTSTYHAILRAAATAPCLREGIDRSLALEAVARAYLQSAGRPAAWPVLAFESAALERGDIPYFQARTSGTALDAGVPVAGFFDRASHACALERLASLDEAAVAREAALIRGAFLARRLDRAAPSLTPHDRFAADEALETVAPLETESLIAAALAIGHALRDRAIAASDGSVNWIGLARAADADRYQLQPLGAGLYSGAVGVALFLAALDDVTGRHEYRRLCQAALSPVLRALSFDHRDVLARWAAGAGIGGGEGLGGIVYGLVRVGRLLGRAEPIDVAARLAELISPELVARDRVFDVIGGSAGAILGLLALHDAIGEVTILDRAQRCAAHLLEHREPGTGTYRTWRTVDRAPLTGFAHGAAGIAYALLRLHAARPDAALVAAAREAIAYETQTFAPDVMNWPDFRTHQGVSGPVFLANWCHGAAGIALARLGGLDALDTPGVRDDIEHGLATTRAWGLHDVDHICCGNAGRAEVLHVAGARLGRAGLTDRARRQAAWVVKRAADTGGYWVIPGLADRVFSPGLFQGVSGIGYTWLRLARPDLPSLLLYV
ncbi:MAG: type 2 lantipeptide synthetase LanM family protein [Acidobacteria bacterium]|nr:type 2 lantipeptide synthetase LanM family protein [Acidobacteriota bacterium]